MFLIDKFYCSPKCFAKVPHNDRDIPCPLKLIPKKSCYLVLQNPWETINHIYHLWPVRDFPGRLRTFAPIVSAHPYCSRPRAPTPTLCIERARQALKWTIIGQMAIAIALLELKDLGRSVTPTFYFRNRFYLQLSPHCSKMNKKSICEVKKKFKISVHGIWNPAILRLQGAWNYGL